MSRVHPEGDIIGGCRPGKGRAWLAWYWGAEDGSHEELHEALGGQMQARRWLLEQAQGDPDISQDAALIWEPRVFDGAQLLVWTNVEESDV
jgi:hypothetical protein